MEINGIEIISKSPQICVPIVAEREEDILRLAKEIRDNKIPLLEWRIDRFSQWQNDNEVLRVLKNLAEICGNEMLPIITLRTKEQGGNAEISADAYVEKLYFLAEQNETELLDMEFFFAEEERHDAAKVLEEIHRKRTRVIASHHNFSETPRDVVLESHIKQMIKADADIAKLAVMPRSMTDVLTLLSVTEKMATKYPDTPLVTMSMGRRGMVSRVSGELFGSAITFASLGEASAPGQVPLPDLMKAMEFVHTYGIEK